MEVPVRNATDEPIPPRSVLRSLGTVDAVRGALDVGKPDADNARPTHVSGAYTIDPGAFGSAFTGPEVILAYDPEGDVPAAGDTIGVAAGSWYATAGHRGFTCVTAGLRGYTNAVFAYEPALPTPDVLAKIVDGPNAGGFYTANRMTRDNSTPTGVVQYTPLTQYPYKVLSPDGIQLRTNEVGELVEINDRPGFYWFFRERQPTISGSVSGIAGAYGGSRYALSVAGVWNAEQTIAAGGVFLAPGSPVPGGTTAGLLWQEATGKWAFVTLQNATKIQTGWLTHVTQDIGGAKTFWADFTIKDLNPSGLEAVRVYTPGGGFGTKTVVEFFRSASGVGYGGGSGVAMVFVNCGFAVQAGSDNVELVTNGSHVRIYGMADPTYAGFIRVGNSATGGEFLMYAAGGDYLEIRGGINAVTTGGASGKVFAAGGFSTTGGVGGSYSPPPPTSGIVFKNGLYISGASTIVPPPPPPPGPPPGFGGSL